MPLDVVPQLFALALERIILLAQGFVLVAPQLLLIGTCGNAPGQRLEQIGGAMQIGGVLPIGHQAGEAAQKMRGFGDVLRLGDRAGEAANALGEPVEPDRPVPLSGQLNEHSASDARFDMLHKISRELREAYRDRITPEIARAMTLREESLMVIHQSNVARTIRKSGKPLSYGAYVLARPKLIKLLIDRQVRKRFGS